MSEVTLSREMLDRAIGTAEDRAADEADIEAIIQALGRVFVANLRRRNWTSRNARSMVLSALGQAAPVTVDILDPSVREGRVEELAAATEAFEIVGRIERRIKRRPTGSDWFLSQLRDAEPQP